MKDLKSMIKDLCIDTNNVQISDSFNQLEIHITNLDFNEAHFINIIDSLLSISATGHKDINIYSNERQYPTLSGISIDEDHIEDVLDSITRRHSPSITYSLKFKLTKGSPFSIYSYNDFLNHADNLPIKSLIESFNMITSDSRITIILFENKFERICINNSSILISHRDTFNSCSISSSSECKLRDNQIKFGFDHPMSIRPFIIEDVNFPDVLLELKKIINKVNTFLYISALAASTKFDTDNYVSFRFDSYQSVSYISNFNNVFYKDKIIWSDIYKWVYSTDNEYNKIRIIHNLLPYYVEGRSLETIDSDIIEALESNLNIYLNENIHKYFDIKNKIVEFIYNMSLESQNISDKFVKNFTNSLFVTSTFIFSVVVMNSIASQKFESIFTKDISYITAYLAILSLANWVISYIVIDTNVKRLDRDFKNVKKSYEKILSQNEISQLFEEKSTIAEYKKDISKSIILYSTLWFTKIILLFYVLCKLGQW